MLATDAAALLLLTAQILFVISGSVFAFSAIDDIFFDCYFLFRCSVHGYFDKNEEKAPALRQLNCRNELFFAIMLPAWRESEVIRKSLSNLIDTIYYSNFHVFVGTYPNDRQTHAEVEILTRRFANVHEVVTPRPGPTCKADCLNAIIARIAVFERDNDLSFAGVVLQDAEDVVHPLSLKLFNYYIPSYDLVQIPVYSLKREWTNLTGGHYMDEFAEFHSKDVLVREKLGNVVPGAGVGTAYSHRAIEFAAAGGEVFNTSSLTEDYEFSFRLRQAGMRQKFARIPARTEDTNGKHTGELFGGTGYIATHEYFPSRFWAAVRQKTRWTIGISLQGWKSFGWPRNWRISYLFWRDRKMLFLGQAILAGFVSVIIFSGYSAYETAFRDGYHLAPLLAENNPFWYVVYFNMIILIHRILQRCIWTRIHYGWPAVPMVPLRYVWGALINYLATSRAIKIYFAHLISGKRIGWDKTAHDFPFGVEACRKRPLPAAGS